jgi:guanylate cyclase soluble subunit beta
VYSSGGIQGRFGPDSFLSQREALPMYGLIHKSVMSMVSSQSGEELWQQIMSEAGIAEEHLITLRSYDDEITYRLIEVTARLTDTAPEKLLENFGRFFIENYSTNQYGYLLSAYGDTTFSLLKNINLLHTNISSTFVGYAPPQFELITQSDDEALLIYKSERTGMTPFVRGLILGMATKFNEVIEIAEQQNIETTGGEHTRFLLRKS